MTASERITYFSKDPIVCPVCGSKFFREDLLSGRGRLVAGDLTDELRRMYEPTQKYGELYPIVYSVTVCPVCYFAAFPQDFLSVDDSTKTRLLPLKDKRLEAVNTLFQEVNFEEPRTLIEGVVSYFLAVICCDSFPATANPTFKQALSSLRGAWLLNTLHSHYPGEHYDYIAKLFYRKAYFFYALAVERDQNGEESLSGITNFGPDTDKNYGYEGVLYISALLQFKYGPRADKEKRIKALENSKRLLSKIFGTGKASRGKPSAILEKAKDIFEKIGEEIKSLEGSSE
ncbi:MAG: DUF2225 domain-containing protein [Spirochaetes bacterium]|nr:MAG: DUF2225 domain-containing protein [Spirochaetota bacterium]